MYCFSHQSGKLEHLMKVSFPFEALVILKRWYGGCSSSVQSTITRISIFLENEFSFASTVSWVKQVLVFLKHVASSKKLFLFFSLHIILRYFLFLFSLFILWSRCCIYQCLWASEGVHVCNNTLSILVSPVVIFPQVV